MGSQVLPENLLWHGLLSTDCSSCQLSAPVWAVHGVTASFRAHPPVLAWGPPRGAGWISAPLWFSTGYKGTTCLCIVFIRGCREIFALVPPPPFSLTLMSAKLFLSHIPLSQFLLCSSFYPFLNMLAQRS